MEKRVDAGLLLSFYGAMLTGRQWEALRLYYEDDLSLSEIAGLCSLSRQGAHDLIRRGEAQLFSLEQKLGLRAKWTRMCAGLGECREAITAGQLNQALRILDDLLREEEEQDGV